jgi:hypothetical protein
MQKCQPNPSEKDFVYIKADILSASPFSHNFWFEMYLLLDRKNGELTNARMCDGN